MCLFCNELKESFEQASTSNRDRYTDVIRLMQELEFQNLIELYAGDCPLSKASMLLEQEDHYTISHFVRCKQCGQLYFLGACIRGKPKYRVIESSMNEDLFSIIWGNVGVRYE